jgi:hypothetical protein
MSGFGRGRAVAGRPMERDAGHSLQSDRARRSGAAPVTPERGESPRQDRAIAEKTNAAACGSQTGALRNPEAEPSHPRSTDPSGVVRFHRSQLAAALARRARVNGEKRPQTSTRPAGRAAKTLRPMHRRTARGSEGAETRASPACGSKPAKGHLKTPRAPSGKGVESDTVTRVTSDRLRAGHVHGTENHEASRRRKGPDQAT